jgi:transcriptional regulator with XRE-family HTH domain
MAKPIGLPIVASTTLGPDSNKDGITGNRKQTLLGKTIENQTDQPDTRGMPKNRGTNALPFGSILRSMMKERALTLKQVAELAGVRTSVVQNWLSQANPHDLQAVAKLSRGLGVSFKSLLLGEQEEITQVVSASELFEESDLFEGICKVSIKKLTPRRSK